MAVATTSSLDALNSKTPSELNDTLINMRETLKGHLSESPPDYQKIAADYDIIGAILHKQNKLDDALISYFQARSLRMKHLPPLHLDYAMSHNNVAIIYIAQQNFKEALKKLDECSNILNRSIHETYHPAYVSYEHAKAEALMGLNRFEEAIEHASTALENSLMIYGDEHLTTAAIQTTIQLIYTRQWQYENRPIENENTYSEFHP
jgi:tetratricopeptide (TPR) repeat protein